MTLGADTLLSAGSANVTLSSTVNGAYALTVNSSGITTFGGAVGGVIPLTRVTTNAGGTLLMNGGSVTTTGAQSYGEAVTLGANTTLDASSGDVTLSSTVDGAYTLTVNSTGTTTFGDAMGHTTALTRVTTNAGGTLVMNGAEVTTTGAQSYGEAVTLGAARCECGVCIHAGWRLQPQPQ